MIFKKARNEKNTICDHRLPVVFKGSSTSPSSGTAFEENPYVLEGSKKAFETKDIEGGGLFVRADMPGIGDEDLRVFMENGEVRFMGTTSKPHGGALDDHDSGTRKYFGAICLVPPVKRIRGDFVCYVRHGVLRMIIPAPS